MFDFLSGILGAAQLGMGIAGSIGASNAQSNAAAKSEQQYYQAIAAAQRARDASIQNLSGYMGLGDLGIAMLGNYMTGTPTSYVDPNYKKADGQAVHEANVKWANDTNAGGWAGLGDQYVRTAVSMGYIKGPYTEDNSYVGPDGKITTEPPKQTSDIFGAGSGAGTMQPDPTTSYLDEYGIRQQQDADASRGITRSGSSAARETELKRKNLAEQNLRLYNQILGTIGIGQTSTSQANSAIQQVPSTYMQSAQGLANIYTNQGNNQAAAASGLSTLLPGLLSNQQSIKGLTGSSTPSWFGNSGNTGNTGNTGITSDITGQTYQGLGSLSSLPKLSFS